LKAVVALYCSFRWPYPD